MTPSIVKTLNQRLGDALGLVCGGMLPRFAWKYAPDQPWFVYDKDNRTLLKKCWADAPAPEGGVIGGVWVLSEWRQSKAFDHHGFSDGIRIPFVREAGYEPYFETALAPGVIPTEALTQNYMWALDRQLQTDFEEYMSEEKYMADRQELTNKKDWRERAAAGYDAHVGAFGNCEPGTAGGFLSFGGV